VAAQRSHTCTLEKQSAAPIDSRRRSKRPKATKAALDEGAQSDLVRR
jgi:hypothetical protein